MPFLVLIVTSAFGWAPHKPKKVSQKSLSLKNENLDSLLYSSINLLKLLEKNYFCLLFSSMNLTWWKILVLRF